MNDRKIVQKKRVIIDYDNEEICIELKLVFVWLFAYYVCGEDSCFVLRVKSD